MKRISLTLLALLLCIITYAQSFEGEIVYKNTYKSKVPSLSDEQFNTMMGINLKWFSKDGEYKIETDGTFLLWQVYNKIDNKLYTKMSNSETLLWNDGAENLEVVLSTQLNKGAVDILGYKCDELILTCKSGIQKYYFSTKLSLDSKLFVNHKYGNWYAYLSLSNAVPLKMTVDSEQFTMESTAVEIKPYKVDKSKFVLPAGVETAKSPY